MYKQTKDQGGTWNLYSSAYDREADLCRKHGIDGEVQERNRKNFQVVRKRNYQLIKVR